MLAPSLLIPNRATYIVCGLVTNYFALMILLIFLAAVCWTTKSSRTNKMRNIVCDFINQLSL